MSEPKRESGGDFFFKGLDKKLGRDKLVRGPSPVELDEVENLLDDAAGAGKKLTAGLNKAIEGLKAIEQCGLTPDAFLVLVASKCKADKNGNATSEATVQRVLEGLFRLGEYVR